MSFEILRIFLRSFELSLSENKGIAKKVAIEENFFFLILIILRKDLN